MQLFKNMARSNLMRSTFNHTATRVFTTKAPVNGAETTLGDVAEIFKLNYTVEFE